MKHLISLASLAIVSLCACNFTQDLGGGSGGGATTSSGSHHTGHGGSTSSGSTTSSTSTTSSGSTTNGECPGPAMAPTMLADNAGTGVAVSATEVFFVKAGMIAKVGKSGGPVTSTAFPPPVSPWTPVSITVDADSVYWTTIGGGSTADAVWRAPQTGGTPIKLADTGIDVGHVTGTIAVANGTVYWSGHDPASPYDARIFSVPAGGGTVTSQSLSALGSYVVTGVAADANGVYFTARVVGSTDGGCVGHVPPGGAPVKLAETNNPGGVAIDDAHVYFGDGKKSGLQRVAKAGGAVEQVTADAWTAFGIAVDSTHAYFTDYNIPCSRVWSVPKAGGPVEIVSSVNILGPTFGIAIDEGSVYWTTEGTGTLQKTAKP